MKPEETKRIYERACRAKRVVPQDEEGRLWHRVLRSFPAEDVEKALDEWWADTTPGHDGQPRGKWLPAPAELKPLVERIAAQREAARRAPQDLLYWECSGPEQHRSSSFLAQGAVPPVHSCRWCGAPKTLTRRCAA